MSLLNKIWSWSKNNFDWIAIGANALVVAGIIYYTVQSTSITAKYELQNQELLQQNKELHNQNKSLRGVLNEAADAHYNRGRQFQKQEVIIDMQNDAIKKLLIRIKELETILNADLIASFE
jgi:hypothetical protein